MSSMRPQLIDSAEQVQQILLAASRRFSQKEMATRVGVAERTIRRWLTGETVPPAYTPDALYRRLNLEPAVPVQTAEFSFIDLFAGIGGTRRGFESAGGQCVFTSEWDRFAQQSYLENYGHQPEHAFAGDITEVDPGAVPDHDVLLAGFPCQ